MSTSVREEALFSVNQDVRFKADEKYSEKLKKFMFIEKAHA